MQRPAQHLQLRLLHQQPVLRICQSCVGGVSLLQQGMHHCVICSSWQRWCCRQQPSSCHVGLLLQTQLHLQQLALQLPLPVACSLAGRRQVQLAAVSIASAWQARAHVQLALWQCLPPLLVTALT